MDDLKNMYFYNHCQKILGKMSDEEIKNVKNLKSNEARIRDLYRHALAVPINYESPGKSFEVAQMFKEKGNEFFKKGKNYGAVELYNQGILNCPQTNGEFNMPEDHIHYKLLLTTVNELFFTRVKIIHSPLNSTNRILCKPLN